MLSRNKKRLHRKRRIRSKVFGTLKKPRVSVFRSLNAMYVQFIDDSTGATVLAADNRSDANKKRFDADACQKLGEAVGKKALEKGIEEAIFDRGGYRYHGKVKSLVEGIRKSGVNI